MSMCRGSPGRPVAVPLNDCMVACGSCGSGANNAVGPGTGRGWDFEGIQRGVVCARLNKMMIG